MGPGQDRFGIPYLLQALLLISAFVGFVSGITAAIGMNEAIFGPYAKKVASTHVMFKNFLAHFFQVIVAGLIVLQIIFSNMVKKKNDAVVNSAS
jgi:formate-dependent nitrite reductase membrane component NrfD